MVVETGSFEQLVGGEGGEGDFLRVVLEHVCDGIVACDDRGVLRYFNRATREFHGLPQEPLPPERWAEHYDLFLSDGVTRMSLTQVPLYRALCEEVVEDVEMVIAPKHGRRRRLLASGRAIFGAGGAKLGAVVSMHEIRGRDAEAVQSLTEQLTEIEARQRLLVDALPVLVSYVDASQRYRLANKAYHAWFGQSPEDIAGKHLREVLGDEVYRHRLPYVERVLRGEVVRFEGPSGHVGQKGRIADLHYLPDYGPDGVVRGFFVLVQDVTETKCTALERERFLEVGTDMIVVASTDGYFTWLSPTWERALGWTADEMKSHHWLHFVHPDDHARTVAEGERLAGGSETISFENRYRHRDGSYRWIIWRVRPYPTDDGFLLYGAASDITARKLAEEELGKFKFISDNAGDAYFLIDHSAKIVYANKLACAQRGYAEDELVGLSLSVLNPRYPAEQVIAFFEHVRKGRQPPLETVHRRKDGSDLPVEINSTYLEIGGRPYLFAAARDISVRRREEEERRQLLDRERAARAEAELANRMKDDFLATLSHELRTPLSAILGWAQVLRGRHRGDEKLSCALEVIDRNARVQIRLIEDMLDMSRVLSGKLKLDVHEVEPRDVVLAAIASVQHAADAKEIHVEHVLDLAGPIKGDPSRLQQIVWNLLANAVKFTPKGGRVRVTLERVDSHIEIAVSDTGEGIEPGFLPFVFDRFRQADASTTRRHGGLGLGLSIVKHLVELHGGTVRVDSPGQGQGTTFTVALPRLVAHTVKKAGRRRPSTAAAGVELGAPPSLDGVSVLVVDDEPDARALVKQVLEDCGAKVSVAASAREGLQLVEAVRPHVILSDIGMPEQDGYELMRRVRELDPERGGKTPAVALTAFARPEDRTRALRSGYQTHVAKPVEPAELAAVVASLVDISPGPSSPA